MKWRFKSGLCKVWRLSCLCPTLFWIFQYVKVLRLEVCNYVHNFRPWESAVCAANMTRLFWLFLLMFYFKVDEIWKVDSTNYVILDEVGFVYNFVWISKLANLLSDHDLKPWECEVKFSTEILESFLFYLQIWRTVSESSVETSYFRPICDFLLQPLHCH